MKLTRAFFLGILALISCGQGDNLKPKTANSETINSFAVVGILHQQRISVLAESRFSQVC